MSDNEHCGPSEGGLLVLLRHGHDIFVRPGMVCIHAGNRAPMLIIIYDEGPMRGLNVGCISMGDPIAWAFRTSSPINTPS